MVPRLSPFDRATVTEALASLRTGEAAFWSDAFQTRLAQTLEAVLAQDALLQDTPLAPDVRAVFEALLHRRQGLSPEPGK